MTNKNTVRLHRVLSAPPERVYRAFLDADAKAKWLPPHGFTGKVHRSTPSSAAAIACRSPTSPRATATRSAGPTWSWSRNERIRYTDRFDDPNLPGEMHVTVTLKAVSAAPNSTSCRKACPT